MNSMRVLMLVLVSAACTERAAVPRDLELFYAERTKEIAGEDGWLTLVGRFELHDGVNPVGSGEGAEVKLPADRASGVVGVVTVADVVTWTATGAQPVVMADDSKGAATVVEHGSLRMHVITRGGKRFLRVKDRAHPALKTFSGLKWFPPGAKWKVNATLEASDAGSTVEITNVLNQTNAQASPGVLRFELEGKTWRLTALTDDEPGFFVIFKDETSGHGTYPAGRFLHASPPGADGNVVLDFNRAYSPPCAFTNFATCPLPPRGNSLALKIEAGERFDGH